MALEGTLHYLDIAHLFQVVGSSKKSGVLEITWEDRRARILFERGRLTNAESNRFRQGIGSFLVKAGYLTETDLETALAIQRSEGGVRRLGGVLCDEFGLKPEDIERQLRRQFELIAFDVFAWPGGRFAFQFQEPREASDRFHVDPIEFILAVGIEAGLLAEEGIEREKAGKERRHVVFLEEDPALLSRYREHWQRKGFWVTCCDDAREFLGYLKECRGALPVVVVSEGCRSNGEAEPGGGLQVIGAVRAMHPGIAVVAVGTSSSAGFRERAAASGARAAVERPEGAGLPVQEAETRTQVFLVDLERAVAAAREQAAEPEGNAQG